MRRFALMLSAACGLLPAQDRAEALLAKMTTAEKAGQLFQSWILARATPAEREKVKGYIRDVGLGGVILSLGTTTEARALIDELQKEAKVPLLVSGDFEAGVAFRLTGATWVGTNMLIGATGLPRLAREAGELTANEGKFLGFHWAFAPVADVNVNPRNPIINVRSFGEDPDLVARFTAAYVEGLERGGMMATAKHFPGHGDVASDSHLTMPTIPGDRARLERIELLPFRAAVKAGVSSIMTGHLAVPGLGEDAAVPATLSAKILTGLLREEMGFQGLIVTDALDMGGVKEKLDPAEASVRALAAGADVLLMPPDPKKARDAVVAAVVEGRVPQTRLDEAALRVLKAKHRFGMFAKDWRPVPERGAKDGGWHWSMGGLPTKAEMLANEIAERGIVLVKDDLGLVPLAKDQQRVEVVLLDKQATGDAPTDFLFGAGALHHELHPASKPEDVAAAVAALKSAPTPIIVMKVKVRSYSGRIGVPTVLQPVVDALRATPRAIVVSMGNPYLIEDFPEVSTYLCAFDDSRQATAAAARALLGTVIGRLPITIPAIAERGAGQSRFAFQKKRAKPEDEGMRPSLAEDLRALLEQAVADRCTPGAVALVARRGRVVVEVAVGKQSYAEDSQIILSDIARYDLASLTKVCATTPLVLRLVAAGKLGLDQKAQELLPDFQGTGKDKVTIRHLLAHCAGLPAYERFYEKLSGKDVIVKAACAVPLMHEPGSTFVYSDLGMILLMACCERAGGAPFDLLWQLEVARPLGMDRTDFGKAGTPIEAAAPIGNPPPTEDDPWRKRVVQGEVHDENAFAMGGVSGHAGLFGTAEDVARIGCAFLGGGANGWLPPALVREATTRANLVPNSTRMLGFDGFAPGGSGGSKLSPLAFGHTGFTGTSLWCDPKTDLCVVLLTNRVHPTRVNAKINQLRQKVHDLVAGAIE